MTNINDAIELGKIYNDQYFYKKVGGVYHKGTIRPHNPPEDPYPVLTPGVPYSGERSTSDTERYYHLTAISNEDVIFYSGCYRKPRTILGHCLAITPGTDLQQALDQAETFVRALFPVTITPTIGTNLDKTEVHIHHPAVVSGLSYDDWTGLIHKLEDAAKAAIAPAGLTYLYTCGDPTHATFRNPHYIEAQGEKIKPFVKNYGKCIPISIEQAEALTSCPSLKQYVMMENETLYLPSWVWQRAKTKGKLGFKGAYRPETVSLEGKNRKKNHQLFEESLKRDKPAYYFDGNQNNFGDESRLKHPHRKTVMRYGRLMQEPRGAVAHLIKVFGGPAPALSDLVSGDKEPDPDRPRADLPEIPETLDCDYVTAYGNPLAYDANTDYAWLSWIDQSAPAAARCTNLCSYCIRQADGNIEDATSRALNYLTTDGIDLYRGVSIEAITARLSDTMHTVAETYNPKLACQTKFPSDLQPYLDMAATLDARHFKKLPRQPERIELAYAIYLRIETDRGSKQSTTDSAFKKHLPYGCPLEKFKAITNAIEFADILTN